MLNFLLIIVLSPFIGMFALAVIVKLGVSILERILPEDHPAYKKAVPEVPVMVVVKKALDPESVEYLSQYMPR